MIVAVAHLHYAGCDVATVRMWSIAEQPVSKQWTVRVCAWLHALRRQELQGYQLLDVELSLSWIRRRFRGWHMANWCSTCWWHMAKWWSTCTCNFSLSKSQPTSTASAGKFIPSTTSAGEFIIIIQVSWNPGCGTPETSEYTARWPSMPQPNRLPIREDSSSPRPWPWCHSIWVQFWTGLTENVDFQTAIEHAAIQGLSQFIEVLWCTMANWHFTMQLPIGNNQIKVWFCWQVVVYHFQIFSRVFSVN